MRNPLHTSTTDLLGMIGLQPKRSAASYVLPTLGALGVGMLAGAGLGLLLAPHRGAETRRMVGGKLTDFGHVVGDTAGKVVRKLKRAKANGSEAVTDALSEVRASEYGDDAYDLGRNLGVNT
jgi:hypothetical protein